MTDVRLMAALLVAVGLTACGGNKAVTADCDEAQYYQGFVDGKRVVSPEGLDQLDEFREMPIPRADSGAPQAPAGRCLDMPPMVGSGS